MCVVSMVADHWNEKWKNLVPWTLTTTGFNWPPVSREEFDKLKKEVEELQALLKKAADYDRRTGQPDCESPDKLKLLREIAKQFGVDLDAALRPPPQ